MSETGPDPLPRGSLEPPDRHPATALGVDTPEPPEGKHHQPHLRRRPLFLLTTVIWPLRVFKRRVQAPR